MQLAVGDQLVTHDFDLAVIDIPSKVRKLVIDEVIGNAVMLKWEAPSDDGNCDLIGYQESSVTIRGRTNSTNTRVYLQQMCGQSSNIFILLFLRHVFILVEGAPF